MREFLQTKKAREFLELIKLQWDADVNFLLEDYFFMKSEEDKYYITSRDVEKVELKKLRLNAIGLYIAEVNNTQVRLSIEGSQLIGPHAKKNVVNVNETQMRDWLKGEELSVEGNHTGFVIIKYNNDFLGSGKFSEGKVLNFIPKVRRVKELV